MTYPILPKKGESAGTWSGHIQTFPGPLTDAQIEAHIDRHEALGPHSHSPEAIAQITRYQLWRVKEGNRRAEKDRQDRLDRERATAENRQTALERSKPTITLARKVSDPRRKGMVLVRLSPSPTLEVPITGYYREHRVKGQQDWSRYGSEIPPDELPCGKVIVNLNPSRIHEISCLAIAATGEARSDVLEVDFSAKDERKPAPKAKPKPKLDTTPPTEDQLRRYKAGEISYSELCKGKDTEIVRQAIHSYDRKIAAEKAERGKVDTRRRIREAERQRRNFEKHPERLRKIKAAPPSLSITEVPSSRKGYTLYELSISRHSKCVCERYQLLRRRPGSKRWRASGRSRGRGDFGREGYTLRRWGYRGGPVEFAIRASSRYGSVLSTIVEVG